MKIFQGMQRRLLRGSDICPDRMVTGNRIQAEGIACAKHRDKLDSFKERKEAPEAWSYFSRKEI